MEICPHCKQEFTDIRALNIHITIAHVAYRIADIEKQLDQQREWNDVVLALLRKENEQYAGIKASMLQFAETTHKIFLGMAKDLREIAQEGYKRDNDLFEELKVISRDSMKADHDLLELINGIQNSEAKMLKSLGDIAEILRPKPIKMRSKDKAR